MFKLIVIDDEYLVRLGLETTIDWKKYNIEFSGTATNGLEGLELTKRIKPDIILTDVKMPILDGLQFVEELNKLDICAKVIVLSGYRDFEYAKETLEKGAISYLLKPIDNDEIVSTVLKAIDELEEERKKKSLIQKAEEQIPDIQRTILQNLISDNYNNIQEIVEKIRYYKMDIPDKGYVIFGQVDDLSIEKIDVVKNANRYLFTELVNNLNALSIKNAGLNFQGHFVIVISQCERDDLKKLFSSLLYDYEKKFSIVVSIGLGNPFFRLEDINRSYNEAKNNVQKKILMTINSVSFGNEDVNNYRSMVNDILKYISVNYNRDITLQEVSNDLNISQSHIMHIFKEDVGKTFNSCLTEYRILMAKKFLESNNYRVYEVANMVGYTDIKYFSQVFKKYEGLSPREYLVQKKDSNE